MICALAPFMLAGVAVSTRCAPEPVSEIAELGTTAWLDDDAVNENAPAGSVKTRLKTAFDPPGTDSSCTPWNHGLANEPIWSAWPVVLAAPPLMVSAM